MVCNINLNILEYNRTKNSYRLTTKVKHNKIKIKN